jgi:hypothetical protein
MKKATILILALVGVAFSSQATSILSDDFNYPDGAIVGAAGSPWLGNTGNAGTATVTNNQLFVAGTSARSQDIVAPLSGNPFMTNGAIVALYAKFTLKVVAPPTAAGTVYFAHFNGEGVPGTSASNHRARINPNLTNLTTGVAASPGKFFLGIGNTTPSGAVSTNPASGQWPTELNTNVTYTVVSRYNVQTGISTLWIDPASEASPSVTADDAVNLVNIQFYSFRQTASQGTMWIDDIRVATSFSEVAGANTAPTISGISSQSIPRDGNTGALPFTVGDAESDPATLTVGRASTNTTLVPVSNIVISNGDGTNRTVTVTPATGEQGKTLITLTVSDGVNTADSAFVVTVGAPSISAIPNQIAVVNAVIPPIAFTITDAEGDTLTPTVSSSNTNLLKSENITVSPTGSSRTLTLVPEANTNGVTTVTLSFSDGFTTTTRSFVLTLTPTLGVLLQDQFAYTSFNFVPNSLYDGVGSPWQTVSGSPYQVQVTNGWAYLSFTNTEDVAALLTNGPFASSLGVVFYTSFTLRETVLPSATGNYFAHLKDSASGTTFRSKIFAATSGAAPGSYRIGIANQGNVGAFAPLDCSLDTDYFVVARYNSGTGESVLWVNPTSEASQSTAATDSAITSSVGAYGLREDTGIGNLQISNLVVSTFFPNIAVPAPITITGISVSGGTVTVNFDAGDSDSPAGFDLTSAGTVTGTYAPVSATITSPSTGKFQATASTSGDKQFYIIKRK